MPRRFFYLLAGAVAGFGVPFAWLLFRAYNARREWWDKWLKTEFQKNDEVYLVLSIFAVFAFALIGYMIGNLSDRLNEESAAVKDSNLTLSQLAETDGLTDLLNARAAHHRLDIEIENSYRSPLTCLLIDIDHFKRINDSCGHPFGDSVLVTVAQLLKRAVRRMDIVGRLGGEEFIVVLPHTPGEKALVVADRIRQAVQSETFIYEEKPVPVTVSLGVVSYPSPELSSKESLLKAVDEALYAAKRAGRNRVVVWGV